MRRLSCVRVGLVGLLVCGGCDFFQELKDADSAGAGSSSSSSSGGGTGDSQAGGPCVVAVDDQCKDQDTLVSCDPATGKLTMVGCESLCGANPNFSCVSTATGQHACWCVVPGKQKVYSCTELETCMNACTGIGPCTDQCFARTDETTARMYGALVYCAELGCGDTCRNTPETCDACVANGVANGSGCSLERAVCDDDRNDEPSYP